MNDEEEKLDQLLQGWQCRVELNPRLGAQVWQRIAEREERSWFGAGFAEAWGLRPLVASALAAAVMLVAVAGGITAAEIQVQTAQADSHGADLERVYFDSINPVAMARNGHVHR